MKPYTILMLALAVLLQNCSSSTDPNAPEYELQNEHPFIAAILVPDGQREWRQEVFVGRVIPNEVAPPAPLGQDSVLQRVVYSLRQRYFAEFVGNTTAIVSISDEQGNEVTLTHDHDGYYFDRNHQLNIESDRTYHLKVRVGDVEYRGETRVPGKFAFTNVADGDTIVPWIDSTFTNLLENPGYRFDWTSSDNAYFYQMRARRSDFYDILYTMDFATGIIGLVYSIPEGVTRFVENEVELFAIDENYAQIFHAGGPFGGSDAWFEWFDNQEIKSLRNRSTISGDDKITGVFGSAARAKVSFVAKVSR